MSTLDASFTTDRVSVTRGSGDATLITLGRMRRYCEANDGYEMRLNATDGGLLVEALACAAENSGDPDFADMVMDFLSTIAETLNVEMI